MHADAQCGRVMGEKKKRKRKREKKRAECFSSGGCWWRSGGRANRYWLRARQTHSLTRTPSDPPGLTRTDAPQPFALLQVNCPTHLSPRIECKEDGLLGAYIYTTWTGSPERMGYRRSRQAFGLSRDGIDGGVDRWARWIAGAFLDRGARGGGLVRESMLPTHTGRKNTGNTLNPSIHTRSPHPQPTPLIHPRKPSPRPHP